MIDMHKYDSLNEKLRIAIKENCKREAEEYKKEMNDLLIEKW